MAIDSGCDGEEVVKAADLMADQLEVWQERHDRLSRGETLIGLSTGLADLDEKLGGLQPEQLIIVAGRPAMGKTTLAMGFVLDAVVRQKKSGLVVSLEMSKGQLLDRAVAAEGKVPLNLIKNGSACESHGAELCAAAAKLKHANLFIADRAGATVGRIRSLARRHKMRYGLDILMIDYLQLMDGDGGNRTEEISGISRGCKLLARELGIPVVLLSQLSRKCEERPNKRPVPSDLRASRGHRAGRRRDPVRVPRRDLPRKQRIQGRGRDHHRQGPRHRDRHRPRSLPGPVQPLREPVPSWQPPVKAQPASDRPLSDRYRRKEVAA